MTRLVLMLFAVFGLSQMANAQMSGNYVIDVTGGGDFTTFTESVAELYNGGVSGPVVVQVRTGSYMEYIDFSGAIDGASAENTITFDAHPDNAEPFDVEINSTAGGVSTIRIENTSFLRFQNIGIVNTGFNNRVISMYGLFEDVIFANNSVSNTSTSGTSSLYANFYHTAGFNQKATNVKIVDNEIVGGSMGIYFNGYASLHGEGNVFSGNTILDFSDVGIEVNNQDNVNINFNHITSQSGINTIQTGMKVNGCNAPVHVASNQVYVIGENADIGMQVTDCQAEIDTDDKILVANNMVSVSGTGSESDVAKAIQVNLNSSTVYLISNSFVVNEISLTSYAMYCSDNTTGVISKNNFIINAGSEDNSYAMKFASSVDLSESNSNFIHTQSSTNFVYFDGVNYASLVGWQQFVSGFDSNSLGGEMPEFLNINSDLHVDWVTFYMYENQGYNFPELLVDIDNEPRNPYEIDYGADQFDGTNPVANAGPDEIVCSADYFLSVPISSGHSGIWTCNDPSVIFDTPNFQQTNVTGLPVGENEIYWSVTDGGTTVNDTTVISNMTLTADGGDDVFLFSSNYPTHISSVQLNATPPQGEDYGSWTIVEPQDLTISPSSDSPEITVSNLGYGENILTWEISNDICNNVDTVRIYSGFDFIPADGVTDLNWNNPTDWSGGVVPTLADSVSLFGCTATISGITAECAHLNIGSGTNLIVDGTARALGQFRTGSLVIEQSAERGTASMHVYGNGNVEIAPDNMRALAAGGIRIRSGGSLVIEQSAERESVERASGSLRIGSRGSLVIEQSAERGRGVAELRIRSGGSLVIEQSAERSVDADLRIGDGGYLYIEDNAPVRDTRAPGSLSLGRGRSLVIEQSAERSAAGARLSMRGGSLVIEQSAERYDRNDRLILPIAVAGGGTLVIEQPTFPGRSATTVHTPGISINGGKVQLGNESTARVNDAMLFCNQLVFETDFIALDRGLAADTNMVIKNSGGLFINPNNSTRANWIRMKPGTSFTIDQGGLFDLTTGGARNPANFVMEEGSSFIDNNETSVVSGKLEHQFYAGVTEYFSSPFEGLISDVFTGDAVMSSWGEGALGWTGLGSADALNVMQGYSVTYPSDDYFSVSSGTFNTGTIGVDLTSSNILSIGERGWNLVGNPFPSSIDWEVMDIEGLNQTHYVYDPVNKNFKLYRRGGVSINGGIRYIKPATGFFVKAESDMTMFVDNPCRSHYFDENLPVRNNTASNLISLSVSANGYTDEALVQFKTDATTEFEGKYDAHKKTVSDVYINVPALYTLGGVGMDHLSINTLPIPSSTGVVGVIVPMNFECGTPGTYIISVQDLNIDASVPVQLKDLKDGTMHDLRTIPSYSFLHGLTDQPERFELHIGGWEVGVEDVEKENLVHNVYSHGATIYVTSSDVSNIDVSVFSIDGKLVATKHINSEGTLSLPDANGIYIVKTVSEAGTVSKQLYLSK